MTANNLREKVIVVGERNGKLYYKWRYADEKQ